MADKKPLRDVLNIRIDQALAREIERIAQAQSSSESEVARQLLAYGVEVSRKIEASKLMLPYDHGASMGKTVVDARWVPYTDDEVRQMEDEERWGAYDADYPE